MLNNSSTDKEILDFPMGGTTVRDLGSLSFLGFIANKLNGVPVYRAATQELLGLVSNPPIGRLPEGERVRIIRKLLEIVETI
jgi:hypothetical protein